VSLTIFTQPACETFGLLPSLQFERAPSQHADLVSQTRNSTWKLSFMCISGSVYICVVACVTILMKVQKWSRQKINNMSNERRWALWILLNENFWSWRTLHIWRCNLHDMHFLIVASVAQKWLPMFATGYFGCTIQALGYIAKSQHGQNKQKILGMYSCWQ